MMVTTKQPKAKFNSFVARLKNLPSTQVRDYRLDTASRALWIGAKRVPLTPLQLHLAAQLLDGPKRPYELWEPVWGYTTPLDEAALNTIWVNVHYLRQRLKGRVKFYGERGWALI